MALEVAGTTRIASPGKLPAKVWSDDPGEVTRWFEEQGTRLPPIPATAVSWGSWGRATARCSTATPPTSITPAGAPPVGVRVSGPVRFRELERESRGHTVRFLRSAGTRWPSSARTEDVDAFRATFATTVARPTGAAPRMAAHPD